MGDTRDLEARLRKCDADWWQPIIDEAADALAEARDQMERITARSESALAMAREQLAEAQERAEEIVFSALHEVFAVCGHCGKRKCPERKSNSRLPDEIFKPVRAALDAATGGQRC